MGYFQCRSPPRRAMTSDGGEKAFDPVLFDVTRISAEEIAEQITKDDFEVFRFIQPDEVTILYLIVSHDSQLVIVSKKSLQWRISEQIFDRIKFYEAKFII